MPGAAREPARRRLGRRVRHDPQVIGQGTSNFVAQVRDPSVAGDVTPSLTLPRRAGGKKAPSPLAGEGWGGGSRTYAILL
jgi:hypothetical protein